MTHQEICNGKLIITNPTAPSIEQEKVERADIVLQDMQDGTFICLKNRNGKIGEIVTQKEITKFMLRN